MVKNKKIKVHFRHKGHKDRVLMMPRELAELYHSYDILGDIISDETKSIMAIIDKQYKYIIEDSFPPGSHRDEQTVQNAIDEWVKVVSGRYHWVEERRNKADAVIRANRIERIRRIGMPGKNFILSIHKDHYNNHERAHQLNHEINSYLYDYNDNVEAFVPSSNPDDNFNSSVDMDSSNKAVPNKIAYVLIKYDELTETVKIDIKLRPPKIFVEIFFDKEFQQLFKQMFKALFRLNEMDWGLVVKWSMRDSKNEFDKISSNRKESIIEKLESLKKLSNKKNYEYSRDDWLKMKNSILEKFSEVIEGFEDQSEAKKFLDMTKFLQYESTMKYEVETKKTTKEKKEAIKKRKHKG